MPAISVVVTDVNLLKEFRVIDLLNSPVVTDVVVFTPISSDATAAACYCRSVGPFGTLVFCK